MVSGNKLLTDQLPGFFRRRYTAGKLYHTVDDERWGAHDLERHDLFNIGDLLEHVRNTDRFGGFVSHRC